MATEPFKRVDGGRGGRRYEIAPPLVPKKVALASVTTILSGGLPKPALKAWGEKLVATAAVDEREKWQLLPRDEAIDWLKKASTRALNKAGNRGTNIHTAAEMVLEGQDPGDSPHAQYVAQFAKDWIARVVAVEQPIINLDDGWAGTADLIFEDCQGFIWLADWKSGKGVYPDYALQLAAYARGSHWVRGVGTDEVRLIEPVPIQKLALLHITDDGLTIHAPIASIDQLYDDFRAVMRVRDALRENKLIELKRPPRPTVEEYVSYLRDRCRWADEQEPKFRPMLTGQWPNTIPTLKAGGLTFAQCEEADELIVRVEASLEVPFGPTRPWLHEERAA